MKVRDFRKDLKQAFDEALAGETVTVERGGVQYTLTANATISDNLQPSGKFSSNFIKETAQGVKIAVPKLCKIHFTPLDDRGRCMQKGCKYA